LNLLTNMAQIGDK